MFALKPIIFGFFGSRDRQEDLFKTGPDQEGLHQRFVELLAQDLDETEIDLINKLVENTQDPWTCLDRFIPYREQTFGMPVFTPLISDRRRFIARIKEINRRKSTKWGYIMLMRLLGFQTCTIVEIAPVWGFDSSTTFDDPTRRFDQRCRSCSGYRVELTGVLTVTPELVQSVLTVIAYNEPIGATLLEVEYNGQPLVNGLVLTVLISQSGDLILVNPYDSSFQAWIDPNGDLIFQSDFAQFYSIDINGDLIFTTQ